MKHAVHSVRQSLPILAYRRHCTGVVQSNVTALQYAFKSDYATDRRPNYHPPTLATAAAAERVRIAILDVDAWPVAVRTIVARFEVPAITVVDI